MDFTNNIFQGMSNSDMDLNHSMRLRFETLSKLASEMGAKSDYQGVQMVITTNLKYMMEVYGYALVYKKGGSSCVFVGFPGELSIISDNRSPYIKMAHEVNALEKPGLFKKEEVDSLPYFFGTSFRKPKVKVVMSYPLKIDTETTLTLIVANKNYSNYYPIDYKFSRFILRITANKLEQLYSQNALKELMAEQKRLLDQLQVEQALSETERNRADELSRLNGELDRFVYIASHDLRSPLTSILGLVSLLETQTSNSDTQKKYLGLIGRSVNRLDHFIRNIVDYSRNSRAEVVSEEVDLQIEVSEILAGLTFIKGFDQIDFQLDLNEPQIIRSDRTRINIILNNFLSNAVKYHDFKKPHLFVSVRSYYHEDKVKIKIEDNGTGIPEEHHEKLFDMFFRATPNGEGSGIGLYIVSEMLKKLNGQISFSSEPGRGTTFLIDIPLIKVPFSIC